MDELKEKYIQFCCDFYNEHAPEDKIWFGRMFDGCHQEHNKRNSSMYRWQFPLIILKSQQAEINQHQLEVHSLGEANLNQAIILAKKQEEIDSLKAQLNNMEACYIQVKKERDDAVYLKNEHRKRRCQLAKELTHKSLRLTDAEFEYKRIKELQAKDCLLILNDAECSKCRTHEDVVMDEDGDLICTDCLFERSCEEMFSDEYDEDDE